MKFWNFKSSEIEPDAVELRIDGDLIDDDDAWIYEWLGIQSASPNAFRKELNAYAGQSISVTIDSYGGSVYAGIGIYNALMEHRRKGGHVNTIGDSKVMSAATIVFMAGEQRKMTPGCIFMVHNPLTAASGYASDMRKAADVLDEVKETILNVYELTTGRSRDELSALMDEETYMSTKRAIEEGFATEELYADVTNTGNKDIDFNHQRFRNFASNDVKNILKALQLKQDAEGGNNKMKNDQIPEITNVAELETAYGSLVKQVRDDAVNAERARMSALDALDDGSAQVHKIVMHAKETGQTADDVKFFVDTAKEAGVQVKTEPEDKAGRLFMDKLIKDNMNSGVNDVKGSIVDSMAGDAAEREQFLVALNKAVKGGRK